MSKKNKLILELINKAEKDKDLKKSYIKLIEDNLLLTDRLTKIKLEIERIERDGNKTRNGNNKKTISANQSSKEF